MEIWLYVSMHRHRTKLLLALSYPNKYAGMERELGLRVVLQASLKLKEPRSSVTDL